jgi:hypothetical protein
VSRRLVLSIVVTGTLAAGAVVPAFAAAPARHKLCVGDPNSTSWCVVWDDPNLSDRIPIH